MRRRILYLAPDLASARRLMDDLLLARVEERHIHVLARRGTPMDGLHEASFLQKSDIVHGAQMGLMLGAGLGCLVGFAVSYALEESDTARIITVLAAVILGALFGAWVSSMIGASVPNSRLAQFRAAIDEGKVLVMADVPQTRVDEVRRRVGMEHPEIEDRGLDPHVPAFP
jgi:hypothetical protein